MTLLKLPLLVSESSLKESLGMSCSCVHHSRFTSKDTVAGTRAIALAIPEPSGLKQGIFCHGLGAQTYWPSLHKR